MLKDRLREELLKQAQSGFPATYKDLADRLALSPPKTIHRIAEALLIPRHYP
jgi:DNA-binding Lrp family transcriptional regulator